MSHDLIQRIRWKLGYREKNKPAFSEHNLSIALQNYVINTLDALKLSEIYSFRLDLVTLIVGKELSQNNNFLL